MIFVNKKNLKHKLEFMKKKNVFYVDKTGLYYKLVPSKTICKNVKPGFKLLKIEFPYYYVQTLMEVKN